MPQHVLLVMGAPVVTFQATAFAVCVALAIAIGAIARVRRPEGNERYHGLTPLGWALVTLFFPPVGIVLMAWDTIHDGRRGDGESARASAPSSRVG